VYWGDLIPSYLPVQSISSWLTMGNCFSDPSKPPGKGQTLGSAPSASTTHRPNETARRSPGSSAPPRTLRGYGTETPLGAEVASGSGTGDGDARDRALRAAEERAKTVSQAYHPSLHQPYLASRWERFSLGEMTNDLS